MGRCNGFWLQMLNDLNEHSQKKKKEEPLQDERKRLMIGVKKDQNIRLNSIFDSIRDRQDQRPIISLNMLKSEGTRILYNSQDA
ncbi:unnamed protein product [Paramecium octaurelia]|uniref:Uncharacterized protein n=1 Tax=Paramecium octaurelia TaxID=43137 RepID=A0A8S1S0K7_PAROT|nr:unnamed protein product [Paramecium octaurelia]